MVNVCVGVGVRMGVNEGDGVWVTVGRVVGVTERVALGLGGGTVMMGVGVAVQLANTSQVKVAEGGGGKAVEAGKSVEDGSGLGVISGVGVALAVGVQLPACSQVKVAVDKGVALADTSVAVGMSSVTAMVDSPVVTSNQA